MPVQKHCPGISPALSNAVMRCLAKLPADRWQTAAELLAVLEPLATPSGGLEPTSARLEAVARPASPRRKYFVAAGIVGLLAVVAGAVAFTLLRKVAPSIAFGRATQFTNESGLQISPAISPDGKLVAFAAGNSARARIFVRPSGRRAHHPAHRRLDTAGVRAAVVAGWIANTLSLAERRLGRPRAGRSRARDTRERGRRPRHDRELVAGREGDRLCAPRLDLRGQRGRSDAPSRGGRHIRRERVQMVASPSAHRLYVGECNRARSGPELREQGTEQDHHRSRRGRERESRDRRARDEPEPRMVAKRRSALLRVESRRAARCLRGGCRA